MQSTEGIGDDFHIQDVHPAVHSEDGTSGGQCNCCIQHGSCDRQARLRLPRRPGPGNSRRLNLPRLGGFLWLQHEAPAVLLLFDCASLGSSMPTYTLHSEESQPCFQSDHEGFELCNRGASQIVSSSAATCRSACQNLPRRVASHGPIDSGHCRPPPSADTPTPSAKTIIVHHLRQPR